MSLNDWNNIGFRMWFGYCTGVVSEPPRAMDRRDSRLPEYTRYSLRAMQRYSYRLQFIHCYGHDQSRTMWNLLSGFCRCAFQCNCCQQFLRDRMYSIGWYYNGSVITVSGRFVCSVSGQWWIMDDGGSDLCTDRTCTEYQNPLFV